jgi:hypothetical protein
MIVVEKSRKFLILIFFVFLMNAIAFAQSPNSEEPTVAEETDKVLPTATSLPQASPVEEESWLNGTNGRPKVDDQVQVLGRENEIGDEDDSSPQTETKTQLRWAKKHGFWANYGIGYSTAGFKRPATDMVFGYDKLFFAALEMGLYLRMSSLTYVDPVYFENTGYSENRTYEISSLLLGPHIRYRLVGQFGLVVGGGVSTLQSKLKNVTTTAPLPSSLTVGDTTMYPLDIGYDLGFYYRYKVGPFRVGAEAGYTINSLKPSNAIGEFYVSLHIEYYIRGIIKETIEVPTLSDFGIGDKTPDSGGTPPPEVPAGPSQEVQP